MGVTGVLGAAEANGSQFATVKTKPYFHTNTREKIVVPAGQPITSGDLFKSLLGVC